MGLRGAAGTSYLGGGHANIHTAERTAKDALAEGLFPGRELGFHQEAKQFQAIRAAILLQET